MNAEYLNIRTKFGSDDLVHEARLARESVVNSAGRELGTARYVCHCGSFITHFGKNFGRRIDEGDINLVLVVVDDTGNFRRCACLEAGLKRKRSGEGDIHDGHPRVRVERFLAAFRGFAY